MTVMKSLVVQTCLCLIGLPSVYGTSKRVLDFMSYFSGEFDNKAQTGLVGDDHDFIQVRFIPVDVNCLQPKSVVLVEEVVNGVVQLLVLVAVTDGIEDTVSLTPYTFTDFKYSAFEFSGENLSNVSCGNIQEMKGCIASFRVASEGYVYGNFPYCSITINTNHPRFTCMHTCTSITSTMPQYSKQASPVEPYEFLLTGKKYPLINPPPGYVSPCGN